MAEFGGAAAAVERARRAVQKTRVRGVWVVRGIALGLAGGGAVAGRGSGSSEGRMAAIEQLSYMTGPLLGNARAGFMAERFGIGRSVAWGGLVCVAAVAATIPALPAFWRYRRSAGLRAG